MRLEAHWNGPNVLVKNGEQVVIGPGDTSEMWLMHGRGTPSSVTVQGYSPGTVRLNLGYTPDGAYYADGGADTHLDFTVVGLDSLDIFANGSWHTMDNNSTITLLKGTMYTFWISKLPSNAPWPTADPVWTYGGSGAGAGSDNVTLTFGVEGTRDLIVKCGTDQRKVTVNVVKPAISQFDFGQHLLWQTPTACAGWGDPSVFCSYPSYVADDGSTGQRALLRARISRC